MLFMKQDVWIIEKVAKQIIVLNEEKKILI
jgi:hypothetical protein